MEVNTKALQLYVKHLCVYAKTFGDSKSLNITHKNGETN